MNVVLPLSEMTTADKLMVIEQIWDDLARTPADVPSPAWHEEVLSVRSQRVQDGKSQFSELSEVRERIQKASQ
jgi:putative addiction module component (TIGR02574 family)